MYRTLLATTLCLLMLSCILTAPLAPGCRYDSVDLLIRRHAASSLAKAQGIKGGTSFSAALASLHESCRIGEILSRRGMVVPMLDAARIIRAWSPYGGLLAQLERYVGFRRFHQDIVAPEINDELFERLALDIDPQASHAKELIARANRLGFARAAAEDGLKIIRAEISAKTLADAGPAGTIYQKPLISRDTLMIIYIIDIKQKTFVVDLVKLERTPRSQLIARELNEGQAGPRWPASLLYGQH